MDLKMTKKDILKIAKQAEYLEPPETKPLGTISITTPVPIGYLCENAVGHKYFRWKKPTSAYKPIALYTVLPEQGDK
jgi:hypothetical protein